MDMKKLLESVDKFAGEPEQKAGDQVKGTDKAKKSKGGKHPFLNKLVGDSKVVKQKDADNAIVENLKKQFESFVPEEESAKVTPEDVVSAWNEVFPNSLALYREILGGATFKFKLAKDKSESANGILDNDPLSYSANINRDGTWKEYHSYMYVRPPEGSYLVYGTVSMRKKTIKNVTREKILKRFKEVHAFVSANADQLHNIKFDIASKLGGAVAEGLVDETASHLNGLVKALDLGRGNITRQAGKLADDSKTKSMMFILDQLRQSIVKGAPEEFVEKYKYFANAAPKLIPIILAQTGLQSWSNISKYLPLEAQLDEDTYYPPTDTSRDESANKQWTEKELWQLSNNLVDLNLKSDDSYVAGLEYYPVEDRYNAIIRQYDRTVRPNTSIISFNLDFGGGTPYPVEVKDDDKLRGHAVYLGGFNAQEEFLPEGKKMSDSLDESSNVELSESDEGIDELLSIIRLGVKNTEINKDSYSEEGYKELLSIADSLRRTLMKGDEEEFEFYYEYFLGRQPDAMDEFLDNCEIHSWEDIAKHLGSNNGENNSMPIDEESQGPKDIVQKLIGEARDPDADYDDMRQRKADDKVKTSTKYYVYDGIQKKAVSDNFNTSAEAVSARDKIQMNKPHLSIQTANMSLTESDVSEKDFKRLKTELNNAFKKVDTDKKTRLKDEIRLMQLSIDARKKELNNLKPIVVKENKVAALKEKYATMRKQLEEVKARQVLSKKLSDIEARKETGGAFDTDRTAKLDKDFNDYVDSNPKTIFKKKEVVDEAPKAPSLATRLKTAFADGEFIGIDHISKAKEGNNTFVFRREYYYSHGGSAEKFATQAMAELSNAGFNPTLLDKGNIHRPFKGGASVANSTHWWAKIQLSDNEEVLDEAPITAIPPVKPGEQNPAAQTNPVAQADAMKNAMAATTTMKSASGSVAPPANLAKAIDAASTGQAINSQDAKALEPVMNIVGAAAKDPKLANQFKTLANQAKVAK